MMKENANLSWRKHNTTRCRRLVCIGWFIVVYSTMQQEGRSIMSTHNDMRIKIGGCQRATRAHEAILHTAPRKHKGLANRRKNRYKYYPSQPYIYIEYIPLPYIEDTKGVYLQGCSGLGLPGGDNPTGKHFHISTPGLGVGTPPWWYWNTNINISDQKHRG